MMAKRLKSNAGQSRATAEHDLGVLKTLGRFLCIDTTRVR